MSTQDFGHGHKDRYPVTVNGETVIFNKPKVTGKELLEGAGLLPVTCYSLFQKLKGCDFEKILLDEIVDISNEEIDHFITKDPDVFNYTVDGEPEMTDRKHLTPIEILRLAGKDSQEFYLNQVMGGEDIVYAFRPHEEIKMLCTGMIFVTAKWQKEIDIEEYGKHCKEVPPAHYYKIRIDKNYYIVNKPALTGKELIDLTGKSPVSQYDILAFFSNQPKPQKIKHDELFDLTQKCLVRFVLQPREQKDGRELRKQFQLPEEDVDFLNQLGLEWECVSAGGLWVLIHGYPIPKGYNTDNAIVALQIVPGYPAAQIDMAYFFPHLQKNSGTGINATTSQQIDGKNFQRWSRHRQADEWKPGIDNICTHLSLVDNWIENDLTR